MKRSVLFFAIVLFCFSASHEIWAQRGSRTQVLEVRLASGMPRNSDWGRALDRIAAEWARVTNNEVRLRVLHDGVEGGDAKMLSSLSANNIQAALFSSFALAEICPSVMNLSVPFQIRNDAELNLVLNEVLPILEAQVNNNFVVVTWSRGGWVNIFSREPVFTPDDLRRQRIATSPDANDMNAVFKTMGFHLVETDMADIGPRLANNMINACYQSPAAVAPLGLHRSLKNMLGKPIAPFIGAIVVNRVTWNRISPERQRELMRVTQSIAAEFDALMPRLVANAVTAMGRDGMSVNNPSPAQEEIWGTELLRAVLPLLGTTFNRDLYYRINGILERARSGQ